MDFLNQYHDKIPPDVRDSINKQLNKQRAIIREMYVTLEGIIMSPFGDHLGDDYPSPNEAAHSFQSEAIDCLDRCDLLSGEPTVPQWQDIKTAPKDGTKIICASIGNSDTVDLETNKLIKNPKLKVHWACTGYWSDKWGKFFDGVEPCGFSNLTSWMPIPDPEGEN